MAKQIHLLHIGKTGGSALKHALRPFADSHGIVFHDHNATLYQLPPEEFIIVTLRDPVARFVSGFNSRLRCGRPRYDIPWTPGERMAFSHYRSPNELAEDLGSKASYLAIAAIGHLRRPLRFWLDIPSVESRTSVFIARQETLQADFVQMKEIISLPHDVSLPEDSTYRHETPSGFSVNLSPLAMAKLQSFYADDISIVNQLRPLP